MTAPWKWAFHDDKVVTAFADNMPASAKVLKVEMVPARSSSVPFMLVMASIWIAFFATSLDVVSSDAAVRSWTISALNWASLHGDPFSPDHIWQPVTCLWLHSGWLHIVTNMTCMWGLWHLMRRSLPGQWWLMFFLVGGAIGNLAYLFFHPQPPADFSHWHRQLQLIFWEPYEPIVGASAGVFALCGAAIATIVRYRSARHTGLVNRMEMHVIDLLIPVLAQMLAVDWWIAGVAWQVHQLGFVVGFMLGFLPRINGNMAIVASRPGVAVVKSVTLRGRLNLPIAAEVVVTPEFDAARDYVVVTTERVGLMRKCRTVTKVLAGDRPPSEITSGCVIADAHRVPGVDLLALRQSATQAS